MSQFYNDAIFWIEVDKIHPNPFQPRREFDEAQLKSLADSIRQYGVLQALVVTRKETEKPDGGLAVEYELVAGERRLRASKLAGLTQVPALIRTAEDTDLMKLELAIIENIQREDLNAVDRARAFERLAKEFNLTHLEIGKKVGKSREYVSNTLRILMLPDYILTALSEGKITEGHTRPLMMLIDRKEEMDTLFKEIIFKKLNVRESEQIARSIAVEKARRPIDAEILEMEGELKEKLGTRVRIEKKPVRPGQPGGDQGGIVKIEFFNKEDLRALLQKIAEEHVAPTHGAPTGQSEQVVGVPTPEDVGKEAKPLTDEEKVMAEDQPRVEPRVEAGAPKADEDDSLYSVSNFSI